MSKYYVLERNKSEEGLSIQLPTELFNESVFEFKEEPFTYNTFEEAQKVKDALQLIVGTKTIDFIILKETND